MYEQVSHSLLNAILDDLKPEIRRQDLRHFYTWLGANFYAIYSLFFNLYGHRVDFNPQMLRLVEIMAKGYINRATELESIDIQREQDHNSFLSKKWVGMALYTNGFAENLDDLIGKTAYFQELGINMVPIMPILMCSTGKSDGGYAISDFRNGSWWWPTLTPIPSTSTWMPSTAGGLIFTATLSIYTAAEALPRMIARSFCRLINFIG